MLYKLFSVLANKVVCEVAMLKDGSCSSDSSEGWWLPAELVAVKLSKVVIFSIYI